MRSIDHVDIYKHTALCIHNTCNFFHPRLLYPVGHFLQLPDIKISLLPSQKNVPFVGEAATVVTGSRSSSDDSSFLERTPSRSVKKEGGVGGGRSSASNRCPFTLAIVRWTARRNANAPSPQRRPPMGAATKAP